ncbi:MAG: histidinol dehydrogenase [Armatimonadota bacterium]|nr:histidinol dehydrogenase [Armatimonadota bacterium]MDR7437171.1 histidinol dehydrogenase [Armatimonadota bacterium]MDR7473220.1 histidinol dehydrogenase [Armatimonadota bacterium]MDR7507386.1 histidinol dehydrogenase [Armatimonadota bacterium]MDR7509683.1 histidinol dehydrogenase [Armatimonadota bacterium]
MQILKAPRTPLEPDDEEVRAAVARIIADVRARGDAAVREYTRRFDGVDREPVVSGDEARRALASLDPADREALEGAAGRIEAFARAQRQALQDAAVEVSPGAHAGHRLVAVRSAGCYIPGGRRPLPSTALMTIIPARVAGVPRIAACAPPGPDGSVHPATLAAVALAGAHEIYCMGGAQAIAALAYGTESVRPVDLICGPGNAFVVEAKRQVYGRVGIDLPAGPSEVCVLADASADPALVAADLLAQAEHDVRARAALVSTDARVARAVLRWIDEALAQAPADDVARTAWQDRGEVAVAADLDEACAYVNAAAPEHVELHLADPDAALGRLDACGAVFIGPASSAVFGDYGAGPTHVLPTGGAARFAGGLWVGTFLRPVASLRLTPDAASALAPVVERLAALEGLPRHARAARMRRRV